MAKKKTPTNDFKIKLQIVDNVYTSSGATLLEALQALKVPEKIMNKAVLTIEHNGKSHEQLYFPNRLKRLFYPSPSFQAVQAKQLETLVMGMLK